MVNKPKNIGTAFETGLVRYLQPNGWPDAERRQLRGALDAGDVTGTPGLVWEAKGGDAARSASLGQIALWMAETEMERINDNAQLGILVIARRGVSPARAGLWRAFLRSDAWAGLLTTFPARTAAPTASVEVTLEHAVRQLRWSGFGEPLASAEALGGAA